MVEKDIERIEINQFEKLLEIARRSPISILEEYVAERLKRRADHKAAVQELDDILALLQNRIQLMSLYLKQKYLLNVCRPATTVEEEFYTKQELANKYRVSVRTVTNWITDGLESEEVGGIKRISHQAVEKFKRSSKGKKFTWRSIANRHCQ